MLRTPRVNLQLSLAPAASTDGDDPPAPWTLRAELALWIGAAVSSAVLFLATRALFHRFANPLFLSYAEAVALFVVLGAVGELSDARKLRFRVLDLKALGQSSLSALAFWFTVVQSNYLMVLLWKGLHPTSLVACFSLGVVFRVRGRYVRQMMGILGVLSGYLLTVQLEGHVLVNTFLTGLGVAACSLLTRQRSAQSVLDEAFVGLGLGVLWLLSKEFGQLVLVPTVSQLSAADTKLLLLALASFVAATLCWAMLDRLGRVMIVEPSHFVC
jgi:hypothetical protein